MPVLMAPAPFYAVCRTARSMYSGDRAVCRGVPRGVQGWGYTGCIYGVYTKSGGKGSPGGSRRQKDVIAETLIRSKAVAQADG